MRFSFIEKHRKEFDITMMCHVLKVSRSGYYAWRRRVPTAREMADADLQKEIKEIFAASSLSEKSGSPNKDKFGVNLSYDKKIQNR